MQTGMPARASHTRNDQEGFIIIEVLVSALILAIVGGAVLTLVTATTRSGATERSHSTAYGLAQAAQAEMRALSIPTLKRYEHEATKTVGGTKFKVVSKSFYVNNGSGTASCSAQNSSLDYVEITSTVTSPALLEPVSLQSIVSPTAGSLSPTHGNVVFQVDNALGEGLPAVSISSTGTGNPGSFSGTTEATGCAIFSDIPAGNYKVTATAGGLITPEGKTSWTMESVGVPKGSTAQVPISFDRPGSLIATFEYLEPSTGKLAPAPVDSMEMFQSENGNKATPFGTPNLTTRSATLEDNSVYPFKTGYTVYAGYCTSNNPDPENKKINTAAYQSVPVAGGRVSTARLQVPALNLSVTSGGKPVKGAKVILTDTSCQYNASNIKREYTTNEIGHVVNSRAEAATKTEAVGLPFGTYNVCVSATVGSETRRVEATGSGAVTLNSLTAAATKALALPTSGSSSACS